MQNLDIPVLTQNPKCATFLGMVIIWLVVASWEWAKDILRSAREFPLLHLPPTQEPMAANRQCCAIKVFVKKLSWALWAILRALFRLAYLSEGIEAADGTFAQVRIDQGDGQGKGPRSNSRSKTHPFTSDQTPNSDRFRHSFSRPMCYGSDSH
ncbi:hypothetical protein P7K49_009628 [Saguinus oedipus]|uniref:Uncharacterized protein n=1 Tax=Saguinus oedipus TaxID=9490 RepID=A0ABQ9VNP2_SAGOE|nr:hypothetical protein P7K49_009628 [Saguinus oedipus]